MSIASVLVDTAHAYYFIRGLQVNGKSDQVCMPTQPFLCRASTPTTTELNNDQVQFDQYQRDVTLITDLYFVDGITPFHIEETWRVVIEDGSPYAGIYVLLGEPVAVRKRDIDDLVLYTLALRNYDPAGR